MIVFEEVMPEELSPGEQFVTSKKGPYFFDSGD
jgi:hypothetical protein